MTLKLKMISDDILMPVYFTRPNSILFSHTFSNYPSLQKKLISGYLLKANWIVSITFLERLTRFKNI